MHNYLQLRDFEKYSASAWALLAVALACVSQLVAVDAFAPSPAPQHAETSLGVLVMLITCSPMAPCRTAARPRRSTRNISNISLFMGERPSTSPGACSSVSVSVFSPRRLVERFGMLRRRSAPILVKRIAVDAGVLPHVEPRRVEAERADLVEPRQHLDLGGHAIARRGEGVGRQLHVGMKVVRRCVRAGRNAAPAASSSDTCSCAPQPPLHRRTANGDRSPAARCVELVANSGHVSPACSCRSATSARRLPSEMLSDRARSCPACQVFVDRRGAQHAERLPRDVGRDERIAVAIAADP